MKLYRIPLILLLTSLSCLSFSCRDRKTFDSDGGTVVTLQVDQNELGNPDEVEDVIRFSLPVFENRAKRLGVEHPIIRANYEQGRIVVELPGITDTDQARRIFQTRGNLYFWETFRATSILMEFFAADAFLVEHPMPGAEEDPDNLAPLSSKITYGPAYDTACLGYATAADTMIISHYIKYLQDNNAVDWPVGFRACWEAKPDLSFDETGKFYALVALNVGDDGRAKVDGSMIAHATAKVMDNGEAIITMNMNAEGARGWAYMTEANVGKQIAIVIDNRVYSYPRVNEAITGGISQITGYFSKKEAEDLVNILLSGSFPIGIDIVEVEYVAPKGK